MILTIDREVQSGNAMAYRHWRVRMRDRDAWMWHLRCELGRTPIPAATGRRSVHVLAYRKRTLDDDNLSSGCKHLRDCLVRLGLLKDDSKTWLSITYEQRLASQSPTKKPHTVITIQDIP